MGETRTIGPAEVHRDDDGSVQLVTSGAIDPVFDPDEAKELAQFILGGPKRKAREPEPAEA